MKLTEQQLSHFDTFGFVVFRQLLIPSEIERFSKEFDAGLDSWLPAGSKHDRSARHYATLMDSITPFAASLLDDPRFADAAEQFMGADSIGIAADGNYYVGDTQWHPDGHRLREDGTPVAYSGVKFTIYLEPQDATNGALRVIPGSHKDPYYSALYSRLMEDASSGRARVNPVDVFAASGADLPAFAFDSQPGDVLAFRTSLWHAAFGGGNHRRMATFVYYDDPQTTEAEAEIKRIMTGNHTLYSSQGHRMYTDFYRSNPDPRHQRWVRRLDELGVLETPGVA